MRTIRTMLAAAAVFFGVAVNDAAAWSYKEHIQFTRLAAMRIVNDESAPADLRAWLRANTKLLPSMDAERDWFLTAAIGRTPDPVALSGLTWWAIVPDIEAGDRDAKNNGAFGQHERLSHFIDLEFFNPINEKKTYQLDLSSLPAVADIPHDINNPTWVRAGYLPFARENAFNKLVDAFRAGRLAPDAAKPEDLDHAIRWAGYLAHYTQDNTQPQHSTMDYQSAQYFKGMRNAPNVHSEMEYRMADDPTQPLPALRQEFWTAFADELSTIKDTTASEDPFASTIEVAMTSYHNLPLIGEAAVEALKPGDATTKPSVGTEMFFHHVGTVDGKSTSVLQMKAHQTALAVVRTEHVLRQAWAAAHAPTTQSTTESTMTPTHE